VSPVRQQLLHHGIYWTVRQPDRSRTEPLLQ